jgi:ribonuclease G
MKQILINEEDFETNVAISEDKRLLNYFTEKHAYARAGNIYKAKVEKVVSNMNFVFVNIGDEKPAFLSEKEYFDMTGMDYKESIALEAETREIKPQESVSGIFEKGQEIIVQVLKEPYKTKGARITTDISLAGYYTVFSPFTRHTGISRRITDENERRRLKSLISDVKKGFNDEFGVIVRTQAARAASAELEKEIKDNYEKWQVIKQMFKKLKAPKLLHEDEPVHIKALRENMDSNVKEIITDSLSIHNDVKKYLEDTKKKNVELRLYEGPASIFEYYEIQSQVSGLYNGIVPFKKGGYMKIDVTEALTVIDINSGKFKGSEDVENSLLMLNMNAAREIARQLILRNIGGLIVVDFIDMEIRENCRKVKQVMDDELSKSKMFFRTSELSEFGLMEITRKRDAKRIEDVYFENCPCCQGRGLVPTEENNCLFNLKKIKYACRKERGKNVTVMMRQSIKQSVERDYKKELRDLESKYKKKIIIKIEKEDKTGNNQY